MRPCDVAPKSNSDTAEHDFARRYPIITAHFGLPEDLGWERFRAAAIVHDLEHAANVPQPSACLAGIGLIRWLIGMSSLPGAFPVMIIERGQS